MITFSVGFILCFIVVVYDGITLLLFGLTAIQKIIRFRLIADHHSLLFVDTHLMWDHTLRR